MIARDDGDALAGVYCSALLMHHESSPGRGFRAAQNEAALLKIEAERMAGEMLVPPTGLWR